MISDVLYQNQFDPCVEYTILPFTSHVYKENYLRYQTFLTNKISLNRCDKCLFGISNAWMNRYITLWLTTGPVPNAWSSKAHTRARMHHIDINSLSGSLHNASWFSQGRTSLSNIIFRLVCKKHWYSTDNTVALVTI